jgi:hypothetical protein
MFGQLLINKNKITTVFNSDSDIPVRASKDGPSRRALGWRTCVRAGAARRKAMERHSPFGGGAAGPCGRELRRQAGHDKGEALVQL